MTSEAGAAEEKRGPSPPALTNSSSREEDTVEALYRQQAAIEMGSPLTGDSASDRAKAYILKKREEAVAALRSLLSDRTGTYDAIKNYNLRAMTVPNLLGGPECSLEPIGDFMSNGDGRLCKATLHADFGSKMNYSLSFNPSTMTCISCSRKHQLVGGRRMTFVLSDQAFPAALPSSSEKLCLFILRIENGTISDLVDKFLQLSKGWRIPPGSILVVTSASQLARCGTAAYAAAMANNGGRIGRAYNGEVEWVPGPPILSCGSTNLELSRSIVEVANWVRSSLPEPAVCLSNTFGALLEALRDNAVGPLQCADERRLMLPVTLTYMPNLKTWASYDSLQMIAAAVNPFSEVTEASIIKCLLEELNSKMGMEVDCSPNFSRSLDPSDNKVPGQGGGFLMVGNSNAARTAAALREEGCYVNMVRTTNWQPTRDGSTALADHVREAVWVGQTGATVFQILDNLLYMGRLPDGTISHAKRDNDRKFHVIGDLVIAGKEAQYNLYKALRPALTAAGSGPIIIITPMQRYISNGCCDDSTHVTNRTNPDFVQELDKSLADTRANMRSFVFTDNLRRVSVVNPAPLFDGLSPTECWDQADPIHPLPVVLRELAKLVVKNTGYLNGKMVDDARYSRSSEEAPASKRGRDWGGGGARGRGYGGRGGGGGPSSFGGGGRVPHNRYR